VNFEHNLTLQNQFVKWYLHPLIYYELTLFLINITNYYLEDKINVYSLNVLTQFNSLLKLLVWFLNGFGETINVFLFVY